MSSLFLRTLREDPADAEVPSHRLLVRAGYVRRVAPGIYSWLPLGLRVLRAVEQVVREEMDAMGAQEIQFPALLPREPYETTHRWTEYGPNIFRLKDRKGGDYLLGPTHEELFTLVVKGEYASYKDYPVVLYQIQTKYRDEERPRAGILRGREFLMKDSYSFDLTDDGLAESYAKHRDAYIKIFDRLGLRYVIVSAMSGAMGGSASEEFLAESETGEDTFVRGPGGYAANVEAVITPAPPAQPLDDKPPAQVHHTPGTPTIETLVAFLNAADLGRTFTAADTLKNVLIKTRLPGADGWELLAVGVPGDREVDMKRLEAALSPAEVALLEEADFAAHPFLVKGYIGPGALAANGVRFLVDPRIVTGTAWVTGADKADHHVVDLVVGRDFTPDGTIEAAEVRAATRHPTAPGCSRPPAGSRSGTSSSSVASTPTPSPRRARPGQQARPDHHGLLRDRCLAPGGRDRGAEPRRARPGLAALGGAVRRTPGRCRQAGRDPGGCRGARRPARRRGAAGPPRRPDGVAGGEVRRSRAGGRPDDRRGRPRTRVRGDRG